MVSRREHRAATVACAGASARLLARAVRRALLAGTGRRTYNPAPEAFRMAAPIERGTTTRLLNRLGSGDSEAANELASLVYAELHDLAGALLARGARATLQPTALVHEAWMRFAERESSFENRFQFYALAGKVMRSVLVDHARARATLKRGGERRQITWVDDGGDTDEPPLDLLDLDQALQRLEGLDAELFRLVELRFFGGLSNADVARALGVSEPTVERRWRLARAWLRAELRP
jgi:RNA polymerase sigma factor (TIGR02999 family)